MKIYIELLIILIIPFIFIVWFLWYRWSRKRSIKKYDPNNDKARKGGTFEPEEVEGAEPRTDAEPINTLGLKQSKGGQLLQKTVVSGVGKDSDSSRKVGEGIRKFFQRRSNR